MHSIDNFMFVNTSKTNTFWKIIGGDWGLFLCIEAYKFSGHPFIQKLSTQCDEDLLVATHNPLEFAFEKPRKSHVFVQRKSQGVWVCYDWLCLYILREIGKGHLSCVFVPQE